MPDLRDRFRSLARTPSPDLWDDIHVREPGPLPEQPRTPRALTVVVAFAVAVAGFVGAILLLGGLEPTPRSGSAVANGRIAFVAFDGRAWQLYSAEPDGSGLVQLTHVAGTVSEPAWSPDGSQIAYVVQGATSDGGTGRSDIWVMRADGSDAHVITDGPGSSWAPAWSPDGSRIAYTHGSDIYVMEADGSNPVSLTGDDSALPGTQFEPVWAPDGTRIAFVGRGADDDLYVMRSDGSDVGVLFSGPGYQRELAWSPDGSTIAFANDTEESGSDVGTFSLIDPRGDAIGRLSGLPPAPQAPDWSPDGRQMAFMANVAGTEREALYVMNADGTDVHAIPGLPRDASWPAWQPVPLSETTETPSPAPSSLNAIVIVRGRMLVGATRDGEVYLTNSDGSDATKLTDAAGEGMIASSPTWSPGGTEIAFVLSPPELAARSDDAGIYVMEADGTHVRRLTNGRYDDHPTWSPHGSEILFVRDQGDSLVVVNADGTEPRALRFDGRVFPPYQWPAWSPDGRRIAFQASDAPHVDTNSVYVADIDGADASRLTPGRADGYPAWSPDGSTIAYAGPDGIYLHDVASGSEQRLTRCKFPNCGFDFEPAWSPDGAQLVFSRQDGGGTSIQLFLVNADGSDVHQLTSGDEGNADASWRPVVEAAPSVTSSPPPPIQDVVYLPPFLQGGLGWETRASRPAARGDAVVAWASTIPLDDWPRTGTPAIPTDTISALPTDGIVVTAESTPWSFDPSLGPFPYGKVDLDLAVATIRGPEAEEPPGDYAVMEIDAPPVLVRVYFGVASPSSTLIAAAQQELDTLELPPVCPAPAKGGYGATLSATSREPGERVEITGPMPFQREDGSYDQDPHFVVGWWNADPKDWPYLSSFSTVTPSPAVDGSDLIRLGEGGEDACDFSIVFTVPDVPPGDYPIVVLQEGGGGSTMEASLVLTVTPSSS